MSLFRRILESVGDTDVGAVRDGGVALAVDGRVFGATRTYEVTFRKLASAGGPVRVRIAGELGYLPPTDAEVVILYIREWSGPRVGDKYVRLPVTTRTVPTPAGSSAKPHVIVSAAGTDVADISARSTFYSTLARHVGEPPLDAFCQRRESSDGQGAHYWRLVVIWGPSGR